MTRQLDRKCKKAACTRPYLVCATRLLTLSVLATFGLILFYPRAIADKSTPSGVRFASKSGLSERVGGVSVADGQLVVAGTDKTFVPRGFTSVGVVYPTPYAHMLCSRHFRQSAAAESLREAQMAMTAGPERGWRYNGSLHGMIYNWDANIVRYQVSQGALDYEHAHRLTAYADMVRNVVAKARAAGLVVILAMQTGRYSCTPHEKDGELQRLPDLNTEHAWKYLLNPALTHDKGVILEVFNEPSTLKACNLGTLLHPDWRAWETGCGTEPQQGMLTVGKYLRSIAPENVLLFDGDGVNFGFRDFVVPRGMPSNSAFTFHPYSYVVRGNKAASIKAWNAQFGDFRNRGHALFVTEWNEAFKCKDPNQTITNYFILKYLPAHSIGMIGYGWDAPAHGSGYLVNSYDYPGNKANYQLVDPNASGCVDNGGRVLQQLFKDEGER